MILSPPVLRTAEDGDGRRGASWLELFFDLVFVVAVAQLAVALGSDLSPSGFGRFGLLFVAVWWSWTGYTMYADRFDTDDAVFRAMMFGGMLGIAALAVSVPGAFAGGAVSFAFSYVTVRVVLIGLYERARRNVPEARSLCGVTMFVFAVGTALWAVSVLTPEPWRFGLWSLALVVEGVTPWVARRAMATTPVHRSHLPERFGLFTIIVLGESLVAVVLGLEGANWSPATAGAAVSGFLVAASIWWLYFGIVELVDVRRSLLARNTFIYSHLAIAMGLTATGVGVKKAILAAGELRLPDGGVWALCGGTALFLAGLGLVAAGAAGELRRRVLAGRVAGIAAALLLVAVGGEVRPAALVSLLVVLLLTLSTVETLRAAGIDR